MTLGCKTSKDVMKAIKDQQVQMVDIRFTDMPGMWQHTSYPTQVFEQDAIDDGLGFDGSSIRGFKVINESDMLLQPDPTTAFIDPFMAHKTLAMIADIKDPVTKEFYSRDPRGVAKKAEAFLKSSGVGDTAYFGPEAEFFVFDNVQYGTGQQYSSYSVDSREGHWNSNRDEGPNLGYKIRPKEGYFPCPPNDSLQDLRAEMALTMIQIGLTVECQHHEVATAGQCEIDMKFDSLLAMADHQMKYKYVVKNVAERRRPSCRSRSMATMARACTATSRSGKPANRCSRTRAAMRDCRRPANGTSAASCATRRRSWPSRPRRPTAIGASCPATRRR
jgi:glutamine synthetase